MTSKIEVIKKAWRESASLLVVGRSLLKDGPTPECNYKVCNYETGSVDFVQVMFGVTYSKGYT